MNTYKIYQPLRRIGFWALAVAAAGVASCSGNTDEGLYPADGVERKIVLVDAAGGQAIGSLLELPSANAYTEIEVEGNVLWEAEILNCEGSWCSIESPTGAGDGKFTLMVADNGSDTSRECMLNVFARDRFGNRLPYESTQIRIMQDSRNISLSRTQVTVDAIGDRNVAITVTANQPWTLSCNLWDTVQDGFISISDPGPMARIEGSSDWSCTGSATFTFNIAANPTFDPRSATLWISSPTSAFVAIPVRITQDGLPENGSVTGSEKVLLSEPWIEGMSQQDAVARVSCFVPSGCKVMDCYCTVTGAYGSDFFPGGSVSPVLIEAGLYGLTGNTKYEFRFTVIYVDSYGEDHSVESPVATFHTPGYTPDEGHGSVVNPSPN